jgi:hypothetical protein
MNILNKSQIHQIKIVGLTSLTAILTAFTLSLAVMQPVESRSAAQPSPVTRTSRSASGTTTTRMNYGENPLTTTVPTSDLSSAQGNRSNSPEASKEQINNITLVGSDSVAPSDSGEVSEVSTAFTGGDKSGKNAAGNSQKKSASSSDTDKSVSVQNGNQAVDYPKM